MVTDPASAETIKYASNAFLATKLSFVNAVAALCEAVGADVNDVVLGMGYDKRIGHEFLKPGPGWGGSCFPKDSRALLYIANRAGYHFDLLEGVITVNEEQFTRVAEKVEAMVGGDVAGRTVAVWGLTFKANTDDRRDSPALEVIARLLDRGAAVQGYDPTVDGPLSTHPDLVIAPDPYAACAGADVLVVLTEWDEFKWLDLDKVAEAMAELRVVDGRNLLDRTALVRRGFAYEGIGRA
jgi:UDPglucose 6-dehydrogenase